jgi:hypothetical protein
MLKRWLMAAFDASCGVSAKSSPSLPARRVLPRTDYRAVSIVPRLPACRSAEERLGQRYLLGEMPRLPLDDCSVPARCRCKYSRQADRRSNERRSPSVVWPRMKLIGLDRRRAAGRRGADFEG